MDEIYKEIPHIKGYLVSDMGNVMSLINKTYPNMIKDQKIDAKGNSIVNIFNGVKTKPKKVATLVMSAFMPSYKNWYLIGHIDGDKQNNCFDNLKIVSEKEYLGESNA